MAWDFDAYGHPFESRANFFFIFQLQNILRSYFEFSTSYGRPTNLGGRHDPPHF